MDEHLQTIALKGEISNFKKHARGHLYFSIKDDGAQINAIMFAGDTKRLTMLPKDGDQVLILGRISLYEPSGSYSIQVKNIEIDGVGVLYQRFEALKKTLEAEGYFDPSKKVPIPSFPKTIGVITSNTGAVIQDIMNTINRRYRLVKVLLYPAQVQGVSCASTVAAQIKKANEDKIVDVLIVGRGGGSIEDLWGFNEREVAEAIFSSTIPIISAVGHETDYTIADFVADLRAPTPTAAAELATPSGVELSQKIIEQARRIKVLSKELSNHKALQLTYLEERLQRTSPQVKFDDYKKTLDGYISRLSKSMQHVQTQKHLQYTNYISRLISPITLLNKKKDTLNTQKDKLTHLIHGIIDHKGYQFDLLKQSLHQLSPLTVMDKGYGLVSKQGHVVTSISDVSVKDTIDVQLKDGQLKAMIQEKKEYDHGK